MFWQIVPKARSFKAVFSEHRQIYRAPKRVLNWVGIIEIEKQSNLIHEIASKKEDFFLICAGQRAVEFSPNDHMMHVFFHEVLRPEKESDTSKTFYLPTSSGSFTPSKSQGRVSKKH